MSEADTRPYDHRADEYDHTDGPNPPHPSWCVCGHQGCQGQADTETPTDTADEAPKSFHTAYAAFDGPMVKEFLQQLFGGPDEDGMTSTPFTTDDTDHALNADDLHMINAALMYCATRLVTGGRTRGAFALTRLAERIEHMRQHGGSVVVVPF